MASSKFHARVTDVVARKTIVCLSWLWDWSESNFFVQGRGLLCRGIVASLKHLVHRLTLTALPANLRANARALTNEIGNPKCGSFDPQIALGHHVYDARRFPFGSFCGSRVVRELAV